MKTQELKLWNPITHSKEMSIMGNPKGLKDDEAVVSFDTEFTASKVVSMQLIMQCNGFTKEYYEVVNEPLLEPAHVLGVIRRLLPEHITEVHLFSHYNKAEVSTLKIEKLNMFIAAASMYNDGLEYEITPSLVDLSGYKKPMDKIQRDLYVKYGVKYKPVEEHVRRFVIKTLRAKGELFDNGGTDDYNVYKEMEFEPKKFFIGNNEITYKQNVHHDNHITVHKEMIFDTLFEGQTVHWKSTKLFMNGSLKAIGKAVGLPKLHLTEEEYIGIDMLDPDKLQMYGMRDVYISQALVNTMGREMLDNLTLSGAVKRDFAASLLNTEKFKSHNENVFSSLYNYKYETQAIEAMLYAPHQGGYFGGDNETITPCILGQSWWGVDLDMNSAYSIAQLRIRAYWSAVIVEDLTSINQVKMKRLMKGWDPLNAYQMGTVTFKSLVLKRGSQYTIPTKLGNSTVWFDHKTGGSLNLAWLWVLVMTNSIDWSRTELTTLTYYQCSGPLLFWDQINEYIDKRKEHKSGTSMNTWFKLKRNGSYGTVGQSGLKNSSKSHLLHGEGHSEKGIRGAYYHPVMASYITAIIQILLQEQVHYAMNSIEGVIHLNSVTDGFAYAHKGDEPIVLNKHYGFAGDIMKVGEMWAPKHISKGVINIKTRYLIFVGPETIEGESRKVTLPSSTLKPYRDNYESEEEFQKALIKATQDTVSVQRRMHTEREIVEKGNILNTNEVVFSVNHNIDAKFIVTGYEVLDKDSMKLIVERTPSTIDFNNLKSNLNNHRNEYTLPKYGTNFHTDHSWKKGIEKLIDDTKAIMHPRQRRLLLKVAAELFNRINEMKLSNTNKMKLKRKAHEKLFPDETINKERFTKKWIKSHIIKQEDGFMNDEMINLKRATGRYITKTAAKMQ